MRKFIGVLLVLMLVVAPVSASVLDDVNLWIDNGIKSIISNLPKLSIANIGTVFVTCSSENPSCSYSGENWHITTNILSSNQILQITLPKGTTWTDSQTKVKATTGSDVILKIIPDKAVIRKSVSKTTLTYRACETLWGTVCASVYPINGYEPSGATSYKEVYYRVELISGGQTYGVDKKYSYNNLEGFFISDNKGNQARLTPSYMIDSGYNIELSNIVYLDNGYTGYDAFFQNTYKPSVDYVNKYIYESGSPKNWLDFLNAMKSKGGLRIVDDISPNVVNSEAVIEYPGGTVGLQGELLIPKAMATTITVQMEEGKPRVDSFTLSPSTWTIGQGVVSMEVKFTNIGQSPDWFTIGITPTSVGVLNYVQDRVYVQPNTQGTFTVRLTPTATSDSTTDIVAIVTASSTFFTDRKVATLKTVKPVEDCGIFGCTVKTQKVVIKAVNEQGSVLSNALIFVDGRQESQNGYFEKDMVLGKHYATTDNSTNKNLYAPTQLNFELKGGGIQTYELRFTTTPQDDGNDMTWIFWLFVIGVFIAIIYVSGLWKYIPILLNPAIIIPLLYLIGIGIVIFLLWGLINAIANFKLF